MTLTLAFGGTIHSPAWGEPEISDEAPEAELTIEVTTDATDTSRATDEQPAEVDPALTVPTHKQASIISANIDGQPKVELTCFCLTPDDRIVAGCTGEASELRIFDADGTYLETWSAPVKPEAIFVLPEGKILLAGDGQLARLGANGQVELQRPAPHAAAILEHPEKIREEVIQQAKQQALQFAKQTEQFDRMIERAAKEIASLREQIEAPVQADEDTASEGAAEAAADEPELSPRKKAMALRRIAMFERSKKQYEDAKRQWTELSGEQPQAELTEQQIEERVKSSTAYKLKASSISAAGNDVFLATRALQGYGYAIWRMDSQFDNGTQIVSELRGCCGQMDVKANEHGLFVAENSRHRVCRFDRQGNSLGTWGRAARDGIDGFGSCCNPMNVAFGPDAAVYTAEDNTGRIKRYSVDGKLLGLVGSVELVPGCKNVSIAVNKDGSRVYMLDITRHHIVRMDARPADEVTKQAKPQPVQTGFSNAVARRLQVLFSGDK
jgi:hypothetical protein